MAMAQSALDTSNRYVPVDTGRLQGSGRIERRPNGLAVVYGGPAAPYALAVHERRGIRYRRGRRRYLASALMTGRSCSRRPRPGSSPSFGDVLELGQPVDDRRLDEPGDGLAREGAGLLDGGAQPA